MKSYLLLPLIFLLSCGDTKTNAQSGQLLKDIETLSSDAYQGRKTGTKGAEMARVYLTNRFKEIGLKSFNSSGGYENDFAFKAKKGADVTGTNLIGYLQGKSEQTMVISAHYDHIGVIKGEIYNGADDNASGVAGLLRIAEYFSKNKPNNTLIFAAFDAEEMDLQGAKAFVSKPPVSLSRIKLNVNMDMISHNDKAELYACGTFKYPALKKYFIISVPDIKVLQGHDDPKLGHDDWTDQSDQGAFNAVKIPFIYFGVEDHKDYHKASDEYQNINPTFFTNAAEAILQIINNIDKERDLQKILQEKIQIKQ